MHLAIGRDIPRGSCDYTLRGLEPDGRCPECALPIEQTLKDWPAHRLPKLELDSPQPV